MSYTHRNPYGLTLYDVSAEIRAKTIIGLMKQVLSTNDFIKYNLGNNYYRNGKEMHRIYFNFDRVESVNQLMNNRSSWSSQNEQWRVARTLPKSVPFYDRCVTGLKIRIDRSKNFNELNQLDLRKPLKDFGKILHCQWTNDDQTEALFTFEDYDAVDRIILTYPTLQIKGNQITFEKSLTANDMTTSERCYMIHVTNLPLRVTSEELSSIFEVPIALIVVYPCFRIEQTRVIGGRSSSEAWIKKISDEKTARILANKKNGIIIRTNRIQCKAMLESINDEELCERFQIGQCLYNVDTCHYKHFSCSQPDTCDDQYCWLGHSEKRRTTSFPRPQFRLENARYRLRFSNLPANVTHEELRLRLNIPAKFSQYLILQPSEENCNSLQMAYLIRQQLENRLRQQIDKYHGTSFSSIITQHIQCQLEINQEFYEWNDSTEMIQSADNSAYASPALSTHSTRPDRPNRALYHPSAISTSSWKPNLSKHSQTNKTIVVVPPVSTNQSTIPKAKPTTNSFKSKSVASIRSAPSDWSRLTGRSCWSKELIGNDLVDSDEYYWMENEVNKEKNVLTKVYSSKTDRAARIRALRERVALEHLPGLSFVPKLLQSNFDLFDNDQSNKKELWTMMKFINGERLSDYMKSNRIDIRQALQITRELLKIIKEIHSRNVIHRDIQPKNILIQQRLNDPSMNFMFINFGCAFIKNYQWKDSSLEDIDDYLGNQFYRMPQFEQRSLETKQFEQSPTIDTTGVCAILFWILTGHEPKESKNIWQQSPHHLREHPKIIKTRIQQVTAFRLETEVDENLYRHLMLIFDRAFANPEEQWSVNELDYQLQFVIALIDDVQSPLIQNTSDPILFPSIPLEDFVVYFVSLIHYLKHCFVHRYSQYVHWSTNENNHWSFQDEIIEHKHLLIYNHQEKNLSIDIHWRIKRLKDQHFDISIQAKDQKNINIQLPIGTYQINDQTNQFHYYFQNFQMEIQTLIHILLKSTE